MLIDKKIGKTAYHALILTDDGLKFVQYDYDGKELGRPIDLEKEEYIEPEIINAPVIKSSG